MIDICDIHGADQQYGSTDVIRGFRICIPFTTGLCGMYDHGADPL